MQNESISKKELLELSKISYGQLYRWKRKNLIPEEWFIKKSTFTGQETFFPKEKILNRIEKIKNMKGDISLNDLSKVLSPNLGEIMIGSEEILKQNIVSQETINFYTNERGKSREFDFEKVLYLYVLENMIKSGKINLDEAKMILDFLEDSYPKYKNKISELIFLRKLGISSCCLVSETNEINFENGMKIVERLNITDLIEELKIKMV